MQVASSKTDVIASIKTETARKWKKKKKNNWHWNECCQALAVMPQQDSGKKKFEAIHKRLRQDLFERNALNTLNF